MELYDIRIDFLDHNGQRNKKVLVGGISQDDAYQMMNLRWDENHIAGALYNFVTENVEWADIYICPSSDSADADEEPDHE
jgi:hypothetical protein